MKRRMAEVKQIMLSSTLKGTTASAGAPYCTGISALSAVLKLCVPGTPAHDVSWNRDAQASAGRGHHAPPPTVGVSC